MNQPLKIIGLCAALVFYSPQLQAEKNQIDRPNRPLFRANVMELQVKNRPIRIAPKGDFIGQIYYDFRAFERLTEDRANELFNEHFTLRDSPRPIRINTTDNLKFYVYDGKDSSLSLSIGAREAARSARPGQNLDNLPATGLISINYRFKY